jgi:hypothetical protein
MKKLFLAVGMVYLLSCVAFCTTAYAQEEDISSAFRRLRMALLDSNVPLKDVDAVSSTLRLLLSHGVGKQDLQGMVIKLAGKGIGGSDLDISLMAVDELIEYGVPVNESEDTVLQGIDEGLALGFKGGDSALMEEMRKAVEAEKQLLDKTKISE